MGRCIDNTISFNTSLRTLSFVKNWCFYKISLVHLLFPKVIYIFIHILSVFWPNITFLGVFEGVFKGLQKTGLNRLRPVNVNRFFLQSLDFKNKKTRPQVRSFAVLVRSGYGLFPVMRPDFQILSSTVYTHSFYIIEHLLLVVSLYT